jgi:hypothetical protein
MGWSPGCFELVLSELRLQPPKGERGRAKATPLHTGQAGGTRCLRSSLRYSGQAGQGSGTLQGQKNGSEDPPHHVARLTPGADL